MKLSMVRVSRNCLPPPGFGLNVGGKSRNGTGISPWANAGRVHIGRLSDARPTAALPPFNIFRRETAMAMIPPYERYTYRRDHIGELGILHSNIGSKDASILSLPR